MRQAALLGHFIGYSKSPRIYAELARKDGTEFHFYLIDTPDPKSFLHSIRSDDSWIGFTVTIPYKVWILDHLDSLDGTASSVGAVNAVLRTSGGTLIGYNTDVEGFTNSLPRQCHGHSSALLLGTGGASMAVRYSLEQIGIRATLVSRTSGSDRLTYSDLSPDLLRQFPIVVNCTPLGGMHYPNQLPPLPYEALTPSHCLIDLVYEPPITPFMREGLARGCTVTNGYPMLVEQANAAWRIWTGRSSL